ncbi:MAG: dTDP-4-dehydrorhamnose reductase [Bellilinea sp.]
MRILLFGKNGQLGWELNRSLITLGELTVLDYPDVDFNRPQTLPEIVRTTRPDVIVNAVAYTNVDKAESEPDVARRINADAVGEIAREAQNLGALLVHFSTDYVFDGAKGSPYVETDTPNPLNVYGKTKLDGEAAAALAGRALILRTSWMYSLRQHNFALSVLEWARKYPVMHVVDDHIGSPTWARPLAEITSQLVNRVLGQKNIASQGVYHLAGAGFTNRFIFAQEILKFDPHPEEWIMTNLLPAKSTDFPLEAARPVNSALDISLFSRTFGMCLPPWREGVQLMMALH